MTEDLLVSLNQALPGLPWGIYICALLAPFVQEDAAVLGAAAASSTGAGDPVGLFAAVLVGLSLSDVWKYGLGRAALTQRWARSLAGRAHTQTMRGRVINRLGMTLMIVRFLPGTRIPFYLASGLLKAPFGKFALFIGLSAAVYVGLAFALFIALGAVMGEQLRAWLPALAIALVVIMLGWQVIRARARKAAGVETGILEDPHQV